jgi:hypothetical protein
MTAEISVPNINVDMNRIRKKHANPENSSHATLATNGKHIRNPIKLSTQQRMLLTNACPGQNSIT